MGGQGGDAKGRSNYLPGVITHLCHGLYKPRAASAVESSTRAATAARTTQRPGTQHRTAPCLALQDSSLKPRAPRAPSNQQAPSTRQPTHSSCPTTSSHTFMPVKAGRVGTTTADAQPTVSFTHQINARGLTLQLQLWHKAASHWAKSCCCSQSHGSSTLCVKPQTTNEEQSSRRCTPGIYKHTSHRAQVAKWKSKGHSGRKPLLLHSEQQRWTSPQTGHARSCSVCIKHRSSRCRVQGDAGSGRAPFCVQGTSMRLLHSMLGQLRHSCFAVGNRQHQGVTIRGHATQSRASCKAHKAELPKQTEPPLPPKNWQPACGCLGAHQHNTLHRWDPPEHTGVKGLRRKHTPLAAHIPYGSR